MSHSYFRDDILVSAFDGTNEREQYNQDRQNTKKLNDKLNLMKLHGLGASLSQETYHVSYVALGTRTGRLAQLYTLNVKREAKFETRGSG